MAISKVLEQTQKTQIGFGGVWVALMVIVLGASMFWFIVASSDKTEHPLLNKKSHYYVAKNKVSIDEVMALSDEHWQPLAHSNLDLSLNAHWFKVPIPPPQEREIKAQLERVIEVSFANLDNINAWYVDDLCERDCILKKYSSGDVLPFDKREVKHEQFLFPVPSATNSQTLYLEVDTLGSMKVPIKLWQFEDYIQYTSSHRIFMGVFYGFMTAIALLNIFLFVTSRNIVTLYYTGYIISLALSIATSQGLGFRYIWPDAEGWQQNALIFFAASNIFFSASFTSHVLRIKHEYKRLNKVYRALRVALVIYILLSAFLPYAMLIETLAPIMLSSMAFIFFTTIYLAFKGNTVAIYIGGAWVALMVSILLGIADGFNWISINLDPSYLVMTSAVLQTLFMALGLAMLFNQQNEIANRAFAAATEQKKKSMEAKEALLKLQIENKEKLEYAIDERTYELEIAIRELNEANHELERKNSIDSLTNIANRRLYDKRIVAEARRSRREKTPLAIAMLDIDHFKKVNDTFGHQCGDEALIHFAQLVKSCLKRPSDTVCRYGGEEFVLILPNTELNGAKSLLETIRCKTQDSPLQCEGKTIKLTVSAGVSCRVIATDEEHSLLHAYADKLLYEAKENGRNQVIAKDF